MKCGICQACLDAKRVCKKKNSEKKMAGMFLQHHERAGRNGYNKCSNESVTVNIYADTANHHQSTTQERTPEPSEQDGPTGHTAARPQPLLGYPDGERSGIRRPEPDLPGGGVLSSARQLHQLDGVGRPERLRGRQRLHPARVAVPAAIHREAE